MRISWFPVLSCSLFENCCYYRWGFRGFFPVLLSMYDDGWHYFSSSCIWLLGRHCIFAFLDQGGLLLFAVSCDFSASFVCFATCRCIFLRFCFLAPGGGICFSFHPSKCTFSSSAQAWSYLIAIWLIFSFRKEIIYLMTNPLKYIFL